MSNPAPSNLAMTREEYLRSAATVIAPLPQPASNVVELLNAAEVMGEWIHHGACRDADLDTFFPDTGDKLSGSRVTLVLADDLPAIAICETCTVRAECAAWAIEHEDFGVWGGLTAVQRQHIRRHGSINRASDEAGVGSKARTLAARGWDLIEIAVRLGLPSEDAVARLLDTQESA